MRSVLSVNEAPKKTSIHLVTRTASAGVAARRSSLMLTLKSATDIRSPRVAKREQTSAHRWPVDIRLERTVTAHGIPHDVKDCADAGHRFMNDHDPRDSPWVFRQLVSWPGARTTRTILEAAQTATS